MKLKDGDKVGIVACSNAQPAANRTHVEKLLETLRQAGLDPVCSPYIFEKSRFFSGTAQEKARALMDFYSDNGTKAIFDISGGDLANEVLEYLDYQVLKDNAKPFFGYSDVTAVINAIYKETGHPGYLYQIRNLIYDFRIEQLSRFKDSLFQDGRALFDFDYAFLQGSRMEGVVVGGNIRCFLKLAGTPYLPDFSEKLLFLESYSGDADRMVSLLNQYRQMGVFDKINGIILGSFTKMEEAEEKPEIGDLVKEVVRNEAMPIVKTREIGHGPDSRAIVIGMPLTLEAN